MERLRQLEGRQSLTDAEVAELRKRADRLFVSGNSDFAQGARDDFFLAAWENLQHYKNPNATGGPAEMIGLEFDNRTSLIVDPPDAKLP